MNLVDLHNLMCCFPNSVVNHNNEFVAHLKANEYFSLHGCENRFDLKCKVLEWFSRGAYKTEPFMTKKSNDEFHRFMLCGINQYLGTNFTQEDMCKIYTHLGNACNHNKTIRFVESGYDLTILQ